MDILSKNKLLVALVAVLAVLDVVLIVFILFVLPPRRLGNQMKPREVAARFLEDGLNLTAEQRTAFASMRERHFQEGDSLMRVRSETLRGVFSLLKDPHTDLDVVRARAGALGAMEVENTVALFQHFREMRAILTDVQKETFDKSILTVFPLTGDPRMMPGPQGPPPPGFDSRGPDPGGPGFGGPERQEPGPTGQPPREPEQQGPPPR